MFGVDFSNCQKHGFVATLANCALRQMRKTIVNSMHVTHGMILQKSTDAHKVGGKNYYSKRKNKKYKNEFMKFRDGNIEKIIYNKRCEYNKYPELKVNVEEVDTTLKENSD